MMGFGVFKGKRLGKPHVESDGETEAEAEPAVEERLLIKADVPTVLAAGEWCAPVEWVGVSQGIEFHLILFII